MTVVRDNRTASRGFCWFLGVSKFVCVRACVHRYTCIYGYAYVRVYVLFRVCVYIGAYVCLRVCVSASLTARVIPVARLVSVFRKFDPARA